MTQGTPSKPTEPKPSAPTAQQQLAAGLPRPPPWWRTLRADPPFQIRLAIGGALIAAIVLFWWIVTRGDAVSAIVSPSKLPSPGAVLGSYSTLKGILLDGILATM